MLFSIILRSQDKVKKTRGRPKKTAEPENNNDTNTNETQEEVINPDANNVNESLRLVAQQLTSLTNVIMGQRKFLNIYILNYFTIVNVDKDQR